MTLRHWCPYCQKKRVEYDKKWRHDLRGYLCTNCNKKIPKRLIT